MPLSEPVSRDLMHLRDVSCRGYRRTDGLWDIEACLQDSKTYGFPNHDRGRIEAGDFLHNLWLRITIDSAMMIRAVESSLDDTPFRGCLEAGQPYQALVGLVIGPGFERAARAALRQAAERPEVPSPLTNVAVVSGGETRAANVPPPQGAAKAQRVATPVVTEPNAASEWASVGQDMAGQAGTAQAPAGGSAAGQTAAELAPAMGAPVRLWPEEGRRAGGATTERGFACTHLTELLRPLATTAFQTLYAVREQQRKEAAQREGALRQEQPPALLDTCHALRADGEVVRRQWPQFARETAAGRAAGASGLGSSDREGTP